MSRPRLPRAGRLLTRIASDAFAVPSTRRRSSGSGGGCPETPRRCTTCPVDELGAAERAQLFERFGRSFEAGASIYAEGDEAEHCFLIQDGRVRLVKRIRSSDRSLTVLRPGDLFGEDALMSRGTRGASAVALTDASVLALDRETFGVLLSSNPEVGLRLVEQLVRRLRHAEEQLENAMLRDRPSRVVNTLLCGSRRCTIGRATDTCCRSRPSSCRAGSGSTWTR